MCCDRWVRARQQRLAGTMRRDGLLHVGPAGVCMASLWGRQHVGESKWVRAGEEGRETGDTLGSFY